MTNQEEEIKARDEDAETYEEWYLHNKGYYYDWVEKIVSVQVIQHIPTIEQRLLALKNRYAQLKPGGICVLSLYNWVSIFKHRFVKEGEFPGGIYYCRFAPSEVETLFKESGFRDISVRGGVNLKLYGALKNRKLSHLFYPVAVLDLFLSRFKFSCLLGSFLVCRGFR